MKKLMTSLCLLILIAEFVTGQVKDTTTILLPQPSYQRYLHKRKANNTAGWITLGAGIGLMGIGSYTYIMETIESTYDGVGEPLFYFGAASTLASIPLFIIAGNNKRQAKLALKNESVLIGNKTLERSNYTALSFTIKL